MYTTRLLLQFYRHRICFCCVIVVGVVFDYLPLSIWLPIRKSVCYCLPSGSHTTIHSIRLISYSLTLSLSLTLCHPPIYLIRKGCAYGWFNASRTVVLCRRLFFFMPVFSSYIGSRLTHFIWCANSCHVYVDIEVHANPSVLLSIKTTICCLLSQISNGSVNECEVKGGNNFFFAQFV